jgi:CubicO group peptidase (beta-lactamase class C family)
MSRAGTRWLAAIGSALLLTACTTTIDHAVPTRASTTDSDNRAPAPPGLPWPQPSDTALLQGQALQAAVQRIAAVAAPAGMRGVTAAVLTPEGSWAGAVGVDGSIRPSWDSSSTSAAVTVLVTPGRAPGPPVHVRLPAAGPRVGPNQTSEPTVRQLLSHTSGIPHYARRSG